jgi:hypothetical protein
MVKPGIKSRSFISRTMAYKNINFPRVLTAVTKKTFYLTEFESQNQNKSRRHREKKIFHNNTILNLILNTGLPTIACHITLW